MQHLEVTDTLAVHLLEIIEELEDKLEKVVEVVLLLLFFLALIDSLCLGDIVLILIGVSIFLIFVPLDNLPDSQDGGEFAIVDIGMMADPDERFPDIGDEVPLGVLLEFLIDDNHLLIEEDIADNCQWEGVLDILDGFIVPVHADISE